MATKYHLFQFKPDRIRERAFRPFNPDTRVDVSDYHCTHTGVLPDGMRTHDLAGLDFLFTLLNVEHPVTFKSYSMSVGDVVVLDGERTYYCDSIGWVQLEQTHIHTMLVADGWFPVYRYVSKLRPVSTASLPGNVRWYYTERPLDGVIRPDLPLSRDHRYGVFTTNRQLTGEEWEHFDLQPVYY